MVGAELMMKELSEGFLMWTQLLLVNRQQLLCMILGGKVIDILKDDKKLEEEVRKVWVKGLGRM